MSDAIIPTRVLGQQALVVSAQVASTDLCGLIAPIRSRYCTHALSVSFLVLYFSTTLLVMNHPRFLGKD